MTDLERDDPLWPGQLAILAAALLYLILPPKLTVGPNWLLPAGELVVFVALMAATPAEVPPRSAAECWPSACYSS